MLTTNQKGAVAETAIALEAIKLGIDVYRPYVDGRYDLIFEIGRELLRIQCKWAAWHGDVVVDTPLFEPPRPRRDDQADVHA